MEKVGGTAHHLIKQHEDDKNGYRAWKVFCEWYDGDAAKNKTPYCFRFNMESYYLTSASTEAQYINNFLISF